MATATNCLATKRPDIARLWHPTKNDLTANDVTPSSTKRVWWLCDVCSYEWSSPVSWRTARSTGCPGCAGQVVTEVNNLAAVDPELASQWHPEKNGELRPSEFTTGTGVKVWWLCSQGHEWKASISARARNRRNGCPKCVYAQSSRIERAIFEAVHAKYPTAMASRRVLRPDGSGRYVRPDIMVPELSLVIEYDGAYWHRDRVEYDTKKDEALRALGNRVLRVREAPLAALGSDDLVVPQGATADAIVASLLPLVDALHGQQERLAA